MYISRDEARILAYALADAKYELNDMVRGFAEKKGIRAIDVFEAFGKKLGANGKDKRRLGRTSQDDFLDCLKRYVVRKEKES